MFVRAARRWDMDGLTYAINATLISIQNVPLKKEESKADQDSHPGGEPGKAKERYVCDHLA